MFQKGLFIDEPKVNLDARRAAMMDVYIDGIDKLLKNELINYQDNSPDARMPWAYLFQNKTALRQISIPNATGEIGEYCFNGCSKLEGVDLPGATVINSNAFKGCSSLASISMHYVTNIGNSAFDRCSHLSNITMPKNTNIPTYAFQYCYDLVGVDLGGTPGASQGIGLDAFYRCSKLSTLILRSSVMWPLTNANAFRYSSLASGGAGCTIYIPKTLYDSLGTGTNDYKASSGWSSYDGYGTITWAQIEGSQYENYYLDGTPVV